MSLTDWTGVGMNVNFVGLDNYYELFFEDETFGKALGNNIIWMAFFLTVPFIMALFCASHVGAGQARRHALPKYPLHPLCLGQRRHHGHLAQPA